MTREIRPFLKSFLSQWHPSNFVIDTTHYVCAEQYMMHQKARLFDDKMIAQKIITSTHPSDHKRLGQHVSGFSQARWDSNKIDIVYAGNHAKFSQNSGLKKKLLATGDDWLVEANAKDIIWGAGLAADDPRITNPDEWRGDNLLGDILMRVRSDL